jgi:(1->4)-alpha-D-glucan 1-alpha-D-glucosylmutase
MMRIPLATYRLQFHADFDFQAAQAIIPYLAELGISDVYASPILAARQGSTHGYDVVDPSEINPELGGLEGFEALSRDIQQHGLGWVQDIVPNHMAFSSQNKMLVDVLENGPNSKYRDYFDIDWNYPYQGTKGRVLAPFLGKFCGDCLESRELQLQYDQGGLSINYYDLKFPIRIESYYPVLTYELYRLQEKLGRKHPAFMKLLGVLYTLKYIPSGESGRERYDQIQFTKQMLWELWNESPEVQAFLSHNIEAFNGESGNPESFNLLEDVLAHQFFRLAFWKVGNEELNYRRFFTVNELISMRIEDVRVFDTVHERIFELMDGGQITGLRIDHIDGLYNPLEYLQRLREHTPDSYLVVEKILQPHEQLPLNWPIQGTSGYDFLGQVNNLFCQQAQCDRISEIYDRFIGDRISCATLVDENKRLIIGKHLAGDIDNLAHLLKQLSGRYRYASDLTLYGLKAALIEILTVFPIYRTYITQDGASSSDRTYIEQVISQAKQNIPNFLYELAFIEKFFSLDFGDNLSNEEKQQWLLFLMRLQQFTGPLMAKGVEDTVLYVYNRLLSLNEVGGHPSEFGISVDEFHTFNEERCAQWPHAMSATSTHDTKRGEDVRARINVLSERPDEWEEQLRIWRDINIAHKGVVDGLDVPDPNDEYLFYQTLIGAFPFDDAQYPEFVERIKEYLVKAIREAKVHTAWLTPDADYEQAFINFADRVLKAEGDNPFLAAFRPFPEPVPHYGIFNSLSQTLLKLTAPGMPDFYQGTEFWDLNLVDPDNRRPVDFEARWTALKDMKAWAQSDLSGLMADLLRTPETGRIKLFLTHQLLQARREYTDLFQRGTYQRLTLGGSLQDHVVAFAREGGGTCAIAIAPRFFTKLIEPRALPLGERVWQETRITPPPGFSTSWHDTVSGRVIEGEDTLWLRDILAEFPVALLVSQQASQPFNAST